MHIKLLSCLLLLMLMIVSCKSKNDKEQAEITAENLIQAYKILKLPAEITESSLKGKADTTTIPEAALSAYIPDSVVNLYRKNKTVFHPLGKIEKKEETYLLTIANETGKKTSLICFVLTTKKNKYLSHFLLINGNNIDSYAYSVSITNEPTFVVVRQKTSVNNQLLYSKGGFAYNAAAKGFINVMNDSNEDPGKLSKVVNPIDTLPRNNPYSGDYIKGENNYLTLRDGRNTKNYVFFIHFSKDNGECTGDLKGSLDLATASKGIYKANGDPCIIDFNFNGNSVTVKEQGSCGNHRGIKCYFDDAYQKKKQPKPAKPARKKIA